MTKPSLTASSSNLWGVSLRFGMSGQMSCRQISSNQSRSSDFRTRLPEVEGSSVSKLRQNASNWLISKSCIMERRAAASRWLCLRCITLIFLFHNGGLSFAVTNPCFGRISRRVLISFTLDLRNLSSADSFIRTEKKSNHENTRIRQTPVDTLVPAIQATSFDESWVGRRMIADSRVAGGRPTFCNAVSSACWFRLLKIVLASALFWAATLDTTSKVPCSDRRNSAKLWIITRPAVVPAAFAKAWTYLTCCSELKSCWDMLRIASTWTKTAGWQSLKDCAPGIAKKPSGHAALAVVPPMQ